MRMLSLDCETVLSASDRDKATFRKSARSYRAFYFSADPEIRRIDKPDKRRNIQNERANNARSYYPFRIIPSYLLLRVAVKHFDNDPPFENTNRYQPQQIDQN